MRKKHVGGYSGGIKQRSADQTCDALPVVIFPAPGPDKKFVPPLLLVKRYLHAGDN